MFHKNLFASFMFMSSWNNRRTHIECASIKNNFTQQKPVHYQVNGFWLLTGIFQLYANAKRIWTFQILFSLVSTENKNDSKFKINAFTFSKNYDNDLIYIVFSQDVFFIYYPKWTSSKNDISEERIPRSAFYSSSFQCLSCHPWWQS